MPDKFSGGMRMKKKIRLGKAAAYGAGAMVGGGLTWLGWRWLEGRGIDPLHLFRKKVEDGHRIYYDPAKDPYLEDTDFPTETPRIDDIDEEDEDEDEDDDPDEPPARTVRVIKQSEPPYEIDGMTWENSEEDEGFAHGRLTYYIQDEQIVDENRELVLDPWKKIGIGNYERLSTMEDGDEMFVRDEINNIDYAIVVEEGAVDDDQG